MVVPVSRGNGKFACRGLIFFLACGDRRRKRQSTIFICRKELLCEIDQDELGFTGCCGVFLRHRCEACNIFEALGDLQRDTGIRMTPVDPVESGHIHPPAPEESFQRLASAQTLALPFHLGITGVLNSTAGRGRGGACAPEFTGCGKQEEADKSGSTPTTPAAHQCLNVPESRWTNPLRG